MRTYKRLLRRGVAGSSSSSSPSSLSPSSEATAMGVFGVFLHCYIRKWFINMSKTRTYKSLMALGVATWSSSESESTATGVFGVCLCTDQKMVYSKKEWCALRGLLHNASSNDRSPRWARSSDALLFLLGFIIVGAKDESTSVACHGVTDLKRTISPLHCHPSHGPYA